MVEKKGILAVVSGFSGAGKGTLTKRLLADYDNYALSVSATTRNPRQGEQEGREYFFKTPEEFEKMIAQNELIEYANYVGHYYGTPKKYVMEQLAAGKDVILEIEVQGALKVKEKYPDALFLFVTPPSARVLMERLTARGTESMEEVRFRMKRAAEESVYMDEYDYLVINDELDACVEEMHSIIQREHRRTRHNGSFIQRIRDELRAV